MCVERERETERLAEFVREYRFYLYHPILVIFALNISINICASLPLFD